MIILHSQTAIVCDHWYITQQKLTNACCVDMHDLLCYQMQCWEEAKSAPLSIIAEASVYGGSLGNVSLIPELIDTRTLWCYRSRRGKQRGR